MMGDVRAVAARLGARVVWNDQTPYGTAVSGRLTKTIREQLHPETTALLMRAAAQAPAERVLAPIAEIAACVREERRRLRYRRFTQDPLFWRPDAAACAPSAVVLTCDDADCDLVYSAASGALASVRAALAGMPTTGPFETWMGRLAEDLAATPSIIPHGPTAPLMIGHACVSLSDGVVRLWTDPFLRPKSIRYAPGRQPLLPSDFPDTRHVVLITHSHQDHFDPGSLLRFPADTVIVTATGGGETPLTVDVATRARQLGFTDVRTLAWGEHLTLGEFEIRAFPFCGEQPLGYGARPDRSDRNVGAFYHVADERGRTFLFLADGGGDPMASCDQWAREIHSAVGAVDVVFANHRTWKLFPPHYLFTSVPQFLLYAPDEELCRLQQIMMSPDDLGRVATLLAARIVVPYAMGGAPWFSELGLGFDHTAPGPSTAFDTAGTAVNLRDDDSLIAADFRSVLLEPGDCLDDRLAQTPAALPLLSPQSKSARPAALALAYGGLEPAAFPHILAATHRVPSAVIIAAPNFLEVILDPSDADHAPGLVAACDAAGGAASWRLAGRRPLTFAAFGASTPWRAYFLRLHHAAFTALRDGADMAQTLSQTLRLTTRASTTALQEITADLLGLTPGFPAQDAAPLPEDLAQHLPPLAGYHHPMLRQIGPGPMLLALAQVKAVHNLFVTAQTLGRLNTADDESAFFERVFAA